MTQAPDVAVVIVSYKSAALAIACLKSLELERSRSSARIRVVVADNDSGDYPAIAAAIDANGWAPWARAVASAHNGGFGYGNNFGARLACEEAVPDYLLVLNPDTEVRPGAIDVLAQFLDAHPKVAIAGSGMDNADGSDWPVAFRFPGLLSELAHGLQLGPVSRLLKRWEVARHMEPVAQPADWVCGATMLIRMSAFLEVDGFDESFFLYFEEVDLCRRLREAGYESWYVPQARIMHIAGQSTGVTGIGVKNKRLPGYWFDSRRRYFVRSYGVAKACAIDLVSLVAYTLGGLKRILLGRRKEGVPYFTQDILRHSILLRRNRELAPFTGMSSSKATAKR